MWVKLNVRFIRGLRSILTIFHIALDDLVLCLNIDWKKIMILGGMMLKSLIMNLIGRNV